MPLIIIIIIFIWIICKIGSSSPTPRARRSRVYEPSHPPRTEPPLKPLLSVATNFKESTARPYSSDTVCQLSIFPRHEVFTQPLSKGKRLKLIFRGTCTVKYKRTSWHGSDGYSFDVCYSSGTYDDNYTHRHFKLLLDGKVPAKGPIEEDRYEHRYAFVYETTGNRLSVLLEPLMLTRDDDETSGTIELCVMPLTPFEELTLSMEDIFSPERLRAEQERKQHEARANRALELAVLAHLESNFLDPDYQKNYARSHVPHILHHDSKDWLAEYHEVIGDPDLCALIEAEHPHVLKFLEARLEVVRIAQRLSVKPPPKPKEPEEKRRLSREEWEARIERYRQRQLDRMRVQAEDHIAKQLQKLELAQELRERAQQLTLDEDDIERLVQQLLGDLDDADEDTGKGFQQV